MNADDSRPNDMLTNLQNARKDDAAIAAERLKLEEEIWALFRTFEAEPNEEE